MAVMTASKRSPEPKGSEMLTKKHTKYHYKARPITATLDHPLILDIKLLKKLDMTTFTKKGLIALSKFCGISLITKVDTKKKVNKCVRTVHRSKKQSGKECSVTFVAEASISHRTKRKLEKKTAKATPRIRFRTPREEVSPDEDSLDVICRQDNKLLKKCIQNTKTKAKTSGKKSVIDSILNDTMENIIPEPCKTCNRSEHPERFHSHPKTLMRLALQEKSCEKKLEERFRTVVTTKEKEESEVDQRKSSPCAKESENSLPQNSLSPCEEQIQHRCHEKMNSSKSISKSVKSNSVQALSSPEGRNKITSSYVQKPQTPSLTLAKPKSESLKKSNLTSNINKKENKKFTPVEEDMKFVTGCYVCGKPVSPKSRILHEKSCISEWRTQNNLISPDKRKPEPKRPDYRFTASGDVDCEGTFESIWANHIDSLVPCKKCGRKFFPDRIERHENCCNNLPISMKNKH